MIRIRITNPHTMEPKDLTNLATYLFACAGHGVLPIPAAAPKNEEVQEWKQPVSQEKNEMLLNTPIRHPNGAPVLAGDLEEDKNYEYTIGVEASGEIAAELKKDDLDIDGYPWDHRIHSRARTKIKDGTWKIARNVSPELVEQVRDEYDTAMAADPQMMKFANSSDEPGDLVRGAPMEVKFVEPAFISGGTGLVPPPPASPAAPYASEVPFHTPQTLNIPSVPVASPGNEILSFNEVVKEASKSVTAGHITQADLTALAQKFGLPNLPSLNQRPDLVPAFFENYKALLKSKGV